MRLLILEQQRFEKLSFLVITLSAFDISVGNETGGNMLLPRSAALL